MQEEQIAIVDSKKQEEQIAIVDSKKQEAGIKQESKQAAGSLPRHAVGSSRQQAPAAADKVLAAMAACSRLLADLPPAGGVTYFTWRIDASYVLSWHVTTRLTYVQCTLFFYDYRSRFS
jgi:hypothetical protein